MLSFFLKVPIFKLEVIDSSNLFHDKTPVLVIKLEAIEVRVSGVLSLLPVRVIYLWLALLHTKNLLNISGSSPFLNLNIKMAIDC
jgi:hypothetical protein